MPEIVSETVLPALAQLLSGAHFLHLIAGVLVGLTVGLLPGLGGIAGLAIVLPFVYGMDPAAALAMMIGLTSVTTTSDTFPSVLLAIPGSAGSQATVLDGFPFAKKGEAARALGAAFSASLFGGIFGALVLTVAIFFAQPILLAIGFGEQLLLVVLALTLVGMLTGPSVPKGLASCGLGLLLGTVGASSSTAEYRLTFDTIYLSDGLPLVVIGLGMFAFPEIVDALRRQGAISESGALGQGWLQGFKDTIRHKWLMLRCASIGAMVGALPGLGGSVIDWIAYGHVLQTSKDKEKFGKGDIRGVIAPESANNAKEGGALIPTLLFGIPGSGSMALLLGGLVLVGIEPGREMIEEKLDLTFVIIWSIALANIFGTAICLGLAGPIARLTTIRYTLIAPFLIVIIYFAAFQANRDWGDLIALTAVGVLGIYMKRFGWSRPALLIGFVLSNRLEDAFYRTVQVYGFSFMTRPVAIILLVLVGLSGYVAWRSKTRVGETSAEIIVDRLKKGPQLVFTGLLILAMVVVLGDVYNLRWGGKLFPLTVAGLTALALLVIIAGQGLRSAGHSALFDAQATADHADDARSLYACLAWFAGLLVTSALVGFLVAAPVFVAVFLRMLARVGLVGGIAGGVATLGLLLGLARILVLEYPRGLLLQFAGLNWPFQ